MENFDTEENYMQQNKPKFHITDVVIPKRTGLPTSGEIICIINCKLFFKLNGSEVGTYRLWTQNYPDWPDGYIYALQFPEPQKHMSFEEFITGKNVVEVKEHIHLTDVQLKLWYSHFIPEVSYVWYPEEDLEIFD